MSENKNMRVWDKVWQTDPATTKKFNRPGGHKGTSMNPTSVFKKATEIFGPIGIGWGFEVDDEMVLGGHPLSEAPGLYGNCAKTFRVRVKLWYKLDGERGEVFHYGNVPYVSVNKYGPVTDHEAPKKALTDGVKKCLFMLGFSADITSGMWDDDQYIAEVTQHFAAKASVGTVAESPEPSDGDGLDTSFGL